ncbi:MAG: putative bifunctional diguanylate cyclase/phosphodiesterase [Solirubrobacteraceae bacterium]
MSVITTTKTISRMRSRLPHLSRATRMSRGEVTIWLLSAGLVAAGVALLDSGAVSGQPVIGSMQVSIWILLIAFAAAERFVVHLHFRRSAHSMSLGEIPLVFALVFASGHDVILAGAIGRLLVLAVHRRLPPIRLAFNFGQFLLGNCIAVIVFHAVAGSATQIDPTVWAAAALATVATSIAAVLLISTAVSLSDGRLSVAQIADSMRTDLIVAAVNTSVGLCAATVVYNDWRAAILMAVPVIGMYLTFQAYVAERQRHGRLEFLYEAARALSRTPDIGTALEGLLAQAVDAFRAEVAEIIFFSPDGNDALRTTVRANGAGSVLEGLEPAIVTELRALICRQELGAFATCEIGDGPLAAYLEQRELGRGMFAVLAGERNCMGAMMIGNPSGRVDRFSADDVKLFETLANNTSVALENDRLGHTVWRMKELQRELQHQASHDPLTDLGNRLLFAERVSEALERDPETVSVIFIDIDDFKTINDTLGHAAGDDLLVAVSQRLRDCVRPSDTLARLGGDEFAIMLERTSSQEEAIQVAERINRRLAERFSVGTQNISVRASAGIATGAVGAGGAVSPEELIRNADVAMYRAKQASKRGWELFESGMEVPVMKRHGLKQRLREAVREDSFDVHYQPIVELDTGRVTACEALVRWLDGPRGCVNPGSFIPIAEEMGVIVALGRSILERACREAQRWPAHGGLAPAVHVNVSPVELRDPHFLAGVAGALDRSGLRPDRLVLEITEGVVLRDPEKSIAILHELRGLGVQLALDDFGTGYSSLSHLRSLPIDWLKIGKPFVDAVDDGGLDRPFVRMILELAADLNLGVVAEGIEDTGQLGALRKLGCGYGQGFYLGSPAELEAAGPRLNDIADYRRRVLVA